MFVSLVSGSSGNASVIRLEGTTLLIDCGMSGKRLINALSYIDIAPDDIDALLITHEHTDHIQGAGVIARRLNVPVYATEGTFSQMKVGAIPDFIQVKNGEAFDIGSIRVEPFAISHDANEPVGYSFYFGNEKYSVATDTGIMTDEIYNSIKGSTAVMLEANYDEEMLKYGEYPYELKKRILGDKGHLSNDAASKIALRLLNDNTSNIMLSHLSEKNNLPEIAYKTVENELRKNGAVIGKDVRLLVANRYEVTKFI